MVFLFFSKSSFVILRHVYACVTVPSLPEVGLVGAGDQWDVDFLGRDDSHLHGSTSFILKVQTHKTLSNRYRSTFPNFTFFLVYMRRGTFLSHASGVSQATVGFITPYHHLSRSMCQKTIAVCIFTRYPKNHK